MKLLELWSVGFDCELAKPSLTIITQLLHTQMFFSQPLNLSKTTEENCQFSTEFTEEKIEFSFLIKPEWLTMYLPPSGAGNCVYKSKNILLFLTANSKSAGETRISAVGNPPLPPLFSVCLHQQVIALSYLSKGDLQCVEGIPY